MNMNPLVGIVLLILCYLLGSVPFGLIIVKLSTGKDIRKIESGRTGGTNAMRAAGFYAGAGTAILDFLKGCVAVWLMRWIIPDETPWKIWLEVLGPVMAVLGHNYSIFLTERDTDGHLKLRGGAGGATAVGGSAGLWIPSFLIIVPIGLLILFGIGYASLATLSVGVLSVIVFGIRAWLGYSPWEYVWYGVLTEILLIIALRPNIKRLLNGTERLVGWRAKRHAKQAEKNTASG